MTQLQPGQMLCGRFQVVRLLGCGGVGEVYEAWDRATGRGVALKTVSSSFRGSLKALARFRREVEHSSRIDHPNVLKVSELLENGDMPVMVMELLAGETLADRLIRGGRLSMAEARELVPQMAWALEAAHRADVIHRDLKPDNIFLEERPGQATRVVLTDFGVSRPIRASSFTASDIIVGTPAYMSPEQVELGVAIPASDYYALGLVIYEMLTGKFPFEAKHPIHVVSMRLEADPVPPRHHLPEISDAWERLILSCLERDPERRPFGGEAIAALLGA